MAIPSYRYLISSPLTSVGSTLNQQVLAELPLVNVVWTESLCEPGEFTGSLPLSGRSNSTDRINQLGTGDPIANTIPAAFTLFVERNGIIVWGGVVWSRQYNSDTSMLTLSGRDLLSVYQHRRYFYDVTLPYRVWAAGTDYNTVFRNMIDDRKAYPANGDDWGIDDSALSTPMGATLENDYVLASVDCRDLYSVMADLSRQGRSPATGALVGFDFGMTYSWATGTGTSYPRAALRTYYPYRGRTFAASDPYALQLTFPGSITRYTYQEDGNSVANYLIAFGPGSNEGQYVNPISPSTALSIPQLDDAVTYSQIPNPRVVDAIAAAEIKARAQAVATLDVEWMTGFDNDENSVAPDATDFDIGDEFLISITDDRFPSGYQQVWRLTRYEVRVGDDGQPETVRGTFALKGTY